MKCLVSFLCALCIFLFNTAALGAADPAKGKQDSLSPTTASSFGSKADWEYAKAQLDLLKLGDSMKAHSNGLHEIMRDIGPMLSDVEDAVLSTVAARIIEESRIVLIYQYLLLQLSISIDESEKPHYYDKLREIIHFAKSKLDSNVGALLNVYSRIQSNAVLVQIDKSRDIMKDSSKLLNTALGMLESMKQYCEVTPPEHRVKIRPSGEAQESPAK